MKISRYSVEHPVVIGMLLIALIAFGVYCLFGLNLEYLPDMSMPEVEVLTVYPGASAEEVEEDVTRLLEDEFATLPNYKSMTSSSMDSLSWISIVYDDSVDPYDQLTELRYRIDSLQDEMPEDAQKSISLVGGATMLPVMEFAIIGGSDTSNVLDYVNDTLKPRLTRIDGVSDITVSGAEEPCIEVKLNMDKVQSSGVSILQVYQVLNYSSFNIPLGSSEYMDKTVSIMYEGAVSTLDDIRNLTVGSSEDGVLIKMSDIADVFYSDGESGSSISTDGAPVIMVSITKRASGNTVEITENIKKVLSTLEEDTGGALTYRIFTDDSSSIKSSLSNVLISGVMGVLIAVVVIFLFTNSPKSTFVIGASIPLSILFTFIGMRLIGSTINLVTTSSFVVALGMIVDGSTVMLEQIFRYLGHGNYTTLQAVERGSEEVGSSVVASVLTTVVVFIPICFLKGIIGMILNGFAIVLIFCMIASLIVSVVIVPWLIRVVSGEGYKEAKKTSFMRAMDKLEDLYRKAIAWSIKHKLYVVAVPAILLFLSLFMVGGLGYTFLPSIDTGDFYISVSFPQSYTLEMTEQKMAQIDAMVVLNTPEVEKTAVFSGMDMQYTSRYASQSNKGYLFVMLKEGNRRDVHTIIRELQKKINAEIPDADVSVTNGGIDRLVGYISDGGGYSIRFNGDNIYTLYSYAAGLREYLNADSEVMDTAIDTDYDRMALKIKMDQEKLSSLGLTSYEAGMISAVLFNGVETGYMTDSSGERNKIKITSDINDSHVDLQTLNRMQIKTLSGSSVSFADLGTLSLEKTVSSLHNSERSASITVSANLVTEDASGVNSRVLSYIKDHPLPNGVETQDAGVMALISDSLGDMITAVIIAVFLVFCVMVIQFERFKQPFIIFLSIPFCLIGVIVSLLVFGSSMTLMSVVAVVALAGIVVNNAIILVDYINTVRNRKRAAYVLGVDESEIDEPNSSYTSFEFRDRLLDMKTERKILYDSIVEGGSSRLRPILMTTLTTLVGMIPMALGKGEGAELYASVGQAIAGGLSISSLITLFIVPVIYYRFENTTLRRKIHEN
ncbi:MAG: efflux RND transporter permease subunit [Sphaerochaetaceae bacterium]|nr:efflux RND transporter permease subunit [Sphaerochaetaceae bacterium]